MGIKSLSLQMIPWCFHMGGVAGQVSCVQMREGAGTSDQDRSIKVIKSDGVVKVYHRPINVSDLMVEFPKHLVCRSDSFTIGQKIPALSDKEKLQLGHNYFLLPKHLFQSALSFVAIASFAASSATNYKNALLKTQPFIVRKAPSGSMQIRVSEEFISKLMMQSSSSSSSSDNNNNKDDDDHHDNNNNNNNNKLCTTAQLVKEYSALVESRQCWKPKLETIRESKRRRSLGSFGIKTRPQQGTTNKATTYKAHQSTKTSTTTHHQQQQQQQQQQQKQIKSSSSSSGSAMAPSSKKSSSSSSSSKSASSTKSNTSKGSSVASAKKKGKKVNSLVRLIN